MLGFCRLRDSVTFSFGHGSMTSTSIQYLPGIGKISHYLSVNQVIRGFLHLKLIAKCAVFSTKRATVNTLSFGISKVAFWRRECAQDVV